MLKKRKHKRTPEDSVRTISLDDPVCIGVDLVALLPGGDNGGAKLSSLELVGNLSRIASNWEFVLFTSERSHDELAVLESQNVRRLCVLQNSTSNSSPPWIIRMRGWVYGALRTILPRTMRTKLDDALTRAARHVHRGTVLREIGADLLFCPFTVPFCYDSSVPVVSIIHDLQYHYYPQFFSEEDRRCRERNFRETSRQANKLICVSEYVRKTVLENSNLEPDRAITILHQLFHRLKKLPVKDVDSILQRLGLSGKEFLLYPANFWAHKNHRMLITAFAMYRARHPESNLRLVCTGALENEKKVLQEAVYRMGQKDWIILPGFLAEEEFTAIFASCLALVFPSLYEGFGMPVLEAMALEKPVICSNVTSLPEVAGDAAFYVDPRKPREIANAIERIATDKDLRKRLIDQGHHRLAESGGPGKMAREYLDVFLDVMRKPGPGAHILHGIYPDGWAGERITLSYEKSSGARCLEVVFHWPQWTPYGDSSIVISDQSGRSQTHVIKKGETSTISFDLLNCGSILQFQIAPVFQPKALGMNDDERMLSCICQEFWITSATGRDSLL
jgi:glycosyltransferase involved in cell wall biosynthesis